MRTFTIVVAAALLLAGPALAERTYLHHWGEADDSILGTFDNCTADVTAEYNRPEHDGYALAVTKTSDVYSGYATAFIACVWGLQPGDQVTAGYWRFDFGGGYPRMRLWAHYNDSLVSDDYRGQDMTVFDGLAYGNNDIGHETGWEYFDYTWTMPADHNGLVIDVVIYGDYEDVLYVDELTLTVPDHAYALVPGVFYDSAGEATPTAPSTWGGVKSLFR